MMQVANYLFALSACWLGFFLLFVLFLRHTTFFSHNRAYLMSTFFGSLFIPLLPRPQWLQFRWPAEATTETPTTAVLPSAELSDLQLTVIEPAIPDHHEFIRYLYWAGTLLALGWTLYHLARLWRLYRKSKREDYSGYTLLRHGALTNPFSFFRYCFWPQEQPTNDAEGRQMLAHELAHIRLKHSFDILLLEVAGIIFWFHPLVYLYRHALRTVHEYQADAEVLQSNNNRKQYGQLLISQALLGMPGLANHFIRSQLKNRILMMTRQPTPRRNVWRYALLLPLLAGMLLAFTNQRNSSPTDPQGISALSDTIPEVVVVGYSNTKVKTTRSEITVTAENIDALNTDRNGQAAIGEHIMQYQITTPEGCALFYDFIKDAQGNRRGSRLVIEKPQEDCIGAFKAGLKALPEGWKIQEQPTGKAALEELISGNQISHFELQEEEETKDRSKSGSGESFTDEVFKVVEEMPRFPGCEEEEGSSPRAQKACADKRMLEYVYRNIRYPEDARNAGIEGTVIVQFIVDKKGSIRSPKVLREIGGGCGDEVVRLIENMPDWIPGRQRGRAVNVQFNLPVKFQISDTTPDQEPETKGNKDSNILRIAEQMPRFPGCEEIEGGPEAKKKCADQRMLEFVYQNIKYPEAARDAGIEGTVIVQFTIDQNGNIRDSKVVREIGGGCGTEALRIVEAMPDGWTPGRQDGKAVAVQYNLPLRFKLPKDKGPGIPIVKDPETSTLPKEVRPEGSALGVQEFALLPNPTHGQVQLQFRVPAQPTEVQVFSNNGKMVKRYTADASGELQTLQLDLSQQPAGTYYVRILQDNRQFLRSLVLQK